MQLPADAQRLRIYLGENDKHQGRPAHEVIVELARQRGMAGATVLRGVLGFGAHSRIHTAKILRLSEDLPLVLELVDKTERIQALLPELDALLHGGGLVTLEPIQVLAYRPGKA